MLDVHAPHESTHSWKDFLIHVATICVGLLIAIGLEQTVEYFHRRHLLHTAENNLHIELHDNRANLDIDRRRLDVSMQQIQGEISQLTALKEHKTAPDRFRIQWNWDAMQAAAWDTARDTGALSLMSYDDARAYDTLYHQQELVNEQASVYIRDAYRAAEPLQAGKRSLLALAPEEIDAMVSALRQTLVDIQYLDDLCDSLKTLYKSTADNL
jgi:hypothetical protein